MIVPDSYSLAGHRCSQCAAFGQILEARILRMSSRPSPEVQRLSSELKTALDQQAAMTAILQVISRSPKDAQPVFERSPRARLGCARRKSVPSSSSTVALVHLAALHGLAQEAMEAREPRLPDSARTRQRRHAARC